MKNNELLCAAGVVAAMTLSFSGFSKGIVMFSIFLILLSILLLNRKAFLILIGLGVLFFLRTEWVTYHTDTQLTGNESVLSGVITEGPYRDGDRAQLQITLPKKERLLVNLSLSRESDIRTLHSLSPGTVCSIRGTLTSPSSASNFYSFDYSHYLRTQSIFWTYDVASLDEMSCIKKSNFTIYTIKKWRHFGLQYLDQHFPEPFKGLAAALIFGERHFLHPDIEKMYQKLGLIHVLAVSGMHVAIISGVLFYSLLRIGVIREHAETVLLFLLPLYAVAAGGAPSVIRAVSLVMTFLVLQKMRLDINPFKWLVSVALILLFLNPYYLFHIGFQLSFLISGSLLLSWPIFNQLPTKYAPVMVTFVSQVAAFPVLLFHFREFSFLSFGLNLLIVPFISLFVLPSAFFLFGLSFLPMRISQVAIPFINGFLELVHRLLKSAYHWNGLQLIFGKPSLIVVCMLFLCIFWLFYRVEHYGLSKKIIIPIVLATCICVFHIVFPYFRAVGYVTILDVGQGDSILIELPFRRAVYLIDGGGTVLFPKEKWAERRNVYDPGANTVVPFLKAKGIRTIDKLIVSHGHKDHYGGLPAVLEEIEVKEMVYAKGNEFEPEELRFLYSVRKQNLPIAWVEDGDFWESGKAVFRVLWPEGGVKSGNNRSIVLWAHFGGSSWLFTGDLEEEGERAILHRYPMLQADLLKVGHHGSRTSSTEPFIQQVNPVAAFISAGRCSRFGHPHVETLETLANQKSKVFRTDLQGAIQITFSDSQVLNVESYLSPPARYECP
ncbi:DNA internalization-related competence protein ComEC/Rec2 [Bacillus piscicola]|uniref:DNA internalization-related competence protein ComEC/Rec2 n=1 Tax=Bacillus piscicola TaxID=1632684 RepID=UPI001F08EAD2|nr:DNA internalization-related competence protein ComEC/Rec2 [Bacillus piscicola]